MINYVEIEKLFNIEKGSLQSSKCIEGEYDFITASSEWKKHKEYTHDTEALIVAVAASGSLGRVHYVNGKFVASDLCFILTPKSKDFPVDLSFYYYIFKSIRDDLVKSTATGTSKLAINKSNFGDYKIPYVDVIKQKEYKKKLIHVEEGKEKLNGINQDQVDLLYDLRQKVLQNAISGELSKKWRLQNIDIESSYALVEKIKAEKDRRFKGIKAKKQKLLSITSNNDYSFELPEEWVWCKLGEIIESSDYGTSEKAREEQEGVPVLGMGNIQALRVVLEAPKKLPLTSKDLPKLLLKNQDLLFNRTNSYELVGKSGVYIGPDDRYTFASYLIRLKFNCNYLSPEYISYVINSNWFRKFMIEPQIIQQTGQANFNGTKLNNSLIPLPPVEEQKFIVKKVQTIMKNLDTLNKRNQDNCIGISDLSEIALTDILK